MNSPPLPFTTDIPYFIHTWTYISHIYMFILFECFFCFPFLSTYKMNLKKKSTFLFQAFRSGASCGGRLWRHEHEVQGCCCGKEDRQIHYALQHERFDLYQQPNWWFVPAAQLMICTSSPIDDLYQQPNWWFVADSDNRGTEYWVAFRVLSYWCQQKSAVSKP